MLMDFAAIDVAKLVHANDACLFVFVVDGSDVESLELHDEVFGSQLEGFGEGGHDECVWFLL